MRNRSAIFLYNWWKQLTVVDNFNKFLRKAISIVEYSGELQFVGKKINGEDMYVASA